MFKNFLILTGLILLLYACSPVHASTPLPTQAERVACYERIHAAAAPAWAAMSPIERAAVGMRAISLCEGSQP